MSWVPHDSDHLPHSLYYYLIAFIWKKRWRVTWGFMKRMTCLVCTIGACCRHLCAMCSNEIYMILEWLLPSQMRCDCEKLSWSHVADDEINIAPKSQISRLSSLGFEYFYSKYTFTSTQHLHGIRFQAPNFTGSKERSTIPVHLHLRQPESEIYSSLTLSQSLFVLTYSILSSIIYCVLSWRFGFCEDTVNHGPIEFLFYNRSKFIISA